MRRAVSSGSTIRQCSGVDSVAIPISASTLPARIMSFSPIDHARPAVGPYAAGPAGKQPPELLLDQTGDGRALGKTVIARDRLQHDQVLGGRREGANLLVDRHAAPRKP